MAGPYPALGFAGALLIAVTAPQWRLDQKTWRLTLPFLPFDGTRPFTAVAFVVGAAALGVAWLGLISRVERSQAPGRDRMRVVVATAFLWFVPVMLGPPLLSSDIYSYAAEGDMVTKGHDPTSQGMYMLQFGEYISHTDKVWRTLPGGNPYGPVQMGIAAGAVEVTGHTFVLTIWLLRFIALGAVLLSIWAIADIARRHGVSPPVAVAIGIANPIVVLHLVGGAHNDAILMALLCAGFAFAQRGRFWLGVVFIALATAVKVPAAAALIYLGWCQPGAAAAVKERLKVIGKAFAVQPGSSWSAAPPSVSDCPAGSQRCEHRHHDRHVVAADASGFVLSGLLHTVGLPSSDQLWIERCATSGSRRGIHLPAVAGSRRTHRTRGGNGHLPARRDVARSGRLAVVSGPGIRAARRDATRAMARVGARAVPRCSRPRCSPSARRRSRCSRAATW